MAEESRNRSEPPAVEPSAGPERGLELLEIVRQLVLELHPERRRTLRLSWTSRLDRDLGIDSLGRAELLLRLGRAFRVTLPEALLAEAETVQDLLNALLRAEVAGGRLAAIEIRQPTLQPSEAEPAQATTLTEVLDWHVEQHAHRTHILLWEGGGEETPITYGELAEQARSVANGLRHRGLQLGERAAIMLPTGADFFRAFFGVLYAGGVPVPIYPPMRMSQVEDHLRRQAGILNNAEAVMLITVPEALTLGRLLRAHVESLRGVETVERLRAPATEDLPAIRQPQRTALLQYTSGSTGSPKGVVLSHANVLANIRAIGKALKVDSSDVCVSWLPLYHDMGLIGAWLGTLYFALPAVIMSPLTFLARPQEWLWAIHRHRATVTAAPNFAYELCVRKIDEGDIEGIDLSCLRAVLNGAEPIAPGTLRRFADRFGKYGLRRDALLPVYGMAENSVALAIPPAPCEPLIDRVKRDAMLRRGEALPAAADDPNPLEFVACGQPLSGHEIRIVDAGGRELGERREGRLQFRGPSATAGYFRNEAATRDLIRGEWLDSGDLAYIAAGEVFITGRSKDIIIRAGRNIHPQEVEAAVGDLEGIRKGCVAVFGSADPASGTERVIVLAETRETSREALAELRRRVEEATTDLLEAPPDEVVLAAPRTVPKTSSGKIRRAAARGIYESGGSGRGKRAPWWQLTRLTIEGLLLEAKRGARSAGDVLYGSFCWMVMLLALAAVWPPVMILPRLAWRWKLLRGFARVVLWVTGTRLTVAGLENLPEGGSVVVTNHASYLDGPVLGVAIPGHPIFVVKKEIESQWLTGSILKRIDTIFVERIDPERSVEDSRKALEAARRGRRLVFFPEGTFTRVPGLLDFRLGAFVIAAQAGVPVVPLTIRGTRSILRDEQWVPRPGSVEVELAEPIAPEGSDFQAVLRLRDAARREILVRCGEPDLSQEHIVFTEAGAERVDTRGV